LDTSAGQQASHQSSLTRLGFTIFDSLASALHASNPPQHVIDDVSEAVFVKSSDGQIVLSNQPYDHNFAGRVTAVGRNAETYLDKSVWLVANASDGLILNGCDYTEFAHSGLNSRGETIAMRTFKKSLLGIGHPRMAILGVIQIDSVVDANNVARIQDLTAYWRSFVAMDERDKIIAEGIASGKKVKDIAQELDVSEKTIENRRSIIYRNLSINGPTELVKVLVRLQDNGFSDFGL
jgi:DNA-binding CsgD family transcriptional regulator